MTSMLLKYSVKNKSNKHRMYPSSYLGRVSRWVAHQRPGVSAKVPTGRGWHSLARQLRV